MLLSLATACKEGNVRERRQAWKTRCTLQRRPLAWINRATQIILCHVKNGSWNIVLHKITQIWCRWTDKIWYSTQTQDLTQLAKLWLLLSINYLCVCVCVGVSWTVICSLWSLMIDLDILTSKLDSLVRIRVCLSHFQ